STSPAPPELSTLSLHDALPIYVVVFDEASQIATWDAIGAIARGRQTIIVGDPKQLPPTNFFGRAESDEENPDLEDHEKDLESILDRKSTRLNSSHVKISYAVFC